MMHGGAEKVAEPLIHHDAFRFRFRRAAQRSRISSLRRPPLRRRCRSTQTLPFYDFVIAQSHNRAMIQSVKFPPLRRLLLRSTIKKSKKKCLSGSRVIIYNLYLSCNLHRDLQIVVV